MKPKIIAQRGDQYLIQTGDGEGRIADTEQGALFAVHSLDSILARGYWEPIENDPAQLELLLAMPESPS